MKIDAILDLIRSLACSQGFYGRLYRELISVRDNDPDRWADIVEVLESQNFTDDLSVILYLEQ